MTKYQKYRDSKLAYQNSYYHKKTGSTRFYADHFLVTFPDGTTKIVKDMFDLIDLMGYSQSYLNKKIRNHLLLEGCRIERVYKE